MNEGQIKFGDFCVDLPNQTVWHGAQELRVTPKAFAVLQYLLDHAG